MDTTIRNLDPSVYRRLRARARAAGITVGEAVNAAMRAYLSAPDVAKRGSILDLIPEPYPKGNERLSEEVDSIVYGA